MSADNARQISAQAQAAGNSQLSNLIKVWEATGQAPSGLESMGVPPGTPLAGKSAATTKIDPKVSVNNYQHYKTQIQGKGENITKEQALSYANNNSDNMTDSDYKSLVNWIDSQY
ncbi:hypothetical protein D3C73_1304620 [compost metagenome]